MSPMTMAAYRKVMQRLGVLGERHFPLRGMLVVSPVAFASLDERFHAVLERLRLRGTSIGAWILTPRQLPANDVRLLPSQY